MTLCRFPATCRRPGFQLNPSNPMAKTCVFTHPGTGSQTGVYHVVSRFVGRRKVFGDEEREVFRAMMGAFAAFHQVEIVTF